MPELWTIGVAGPNSIGRFAERLEADGFDGVAVVDSQNLSGDPYVALALAATATVALGLATGVTNPYTRHPAATASSIASVQTLSGGPGRARHRAGRQRARPPRAGAGARCRCSSRYLRRLQGYLRGEDVPFDDNADAEWRPSTPSASATSPPPAASSGSPACPRCPSTWPPAGRG